MVSGFAYVKPLELKKWNSPSAASNLLGSSYLILTLDFDRNATSVYQVEKRWKVWTTAQSWKTREGTKQKHTKKKPRGCALKAIWRVSRSTRFLSQPMSQCPCASIFFIFFNLSNQTIFVDGPHGHILLLACICGGEDHGAVLLPGRTDTQELSSHQRHEEETSPPWELHRAIGESQPPFMLQIWSKYW